MAVDVRMPKLSDNMESGLIIRWMKAPGDRVTKGEALAEVETDKADVELEAAESGVLREITVAEGQSAAVGAVIAVLAAAGDGASASGAAEPPAPAKARSADAEDADRRSAAASDSDEDEPEQPPQRAAAPAAKPKPATSAKPAAPAKPAAVAKPAIGPKPAAAARPPRQQTNNDAQSAVRASPLAWRLAEDNGIDLTTVRGSGPGGRILQRDVEALVEAPPAPVEASAADAPDSEATTAAATRLVPASRMRQAIARRMSEAKRDIPHFYVTAEVDMTEAMHLRESIKRREAMPGLTVTHLLVRALAVALVRHPNVNGSWRDGAIELHDDVNIGIAVAVDDGLVVPVLHRAQTLSLGEIAARAGELTERARQNRFSGDDLSGSTFSISNVGMLDIEELTAVINPPNAAILAVGAVKERPIVRAGQLAVAQTMRATLSCDHRVLNGLEGGRFLEELKSILENPVTLLLE
jgi:pyruvate dehydrogenase E2 component (dihydrolipoamide acetyltransferase)